MPPPLNETVVYCRCSYRTCSLAHSSVIVLLVMIALQLVVVVIYDARRRGRRPIVPAEEMPYAVAVTSVDDA